jgi:hypothetical protein
VTSTIAEISSEGDQEELRSIAKWLRNEDDLRGRVDLIKHSNQTDQMGSVIDTIAVAVGSGGMGVTLIKSLFVYLTQRRRHEKITIKFKREDGREVKLDLADTDSAEKVVKQALNFFDADR